MIYKNENLIYILYYNIDQLFEMNPRHMLFHICLVYIIRGTVAVWLFITA